MARKKFDMGVDHATFYLPGDDRPTRFVNLEMKLEPDDDMTWFASQDVEFFTIDKDIYVRGYIDEDAYRIRSGLPPKMPRLWQDQGDQA